MKKHSKSGRTLRGKKQHFFKLDAAAEYIEKNGYKCAPITKIFKLDAAAEYIEKNGYKWAAMTKKCGDW